MKITKFGHCCLLVEEREARILTDPGVYSSAQDSVQNINAIIITHDHPDHLHTESLKTVLKNNPEVKIFTNESVGKILTKENIVFEVIQDNSQIEIAGIKVTSFNAPHEFIAESVPLPENTAFLINDKLLCAGDSFFVPTHSVEILALPVAGPWMKLSEAIAYAKKVAPKKAFPVHDGMLKVIGPVHKVPQQELTAVGIEFFPLLSGEEIIL